MRRRRWSSEEKIKIVLEGLRVENNIAELCRRCEIDQALYYRWREIFLQGGRAALEDGLKRRGERQNQEKIKEYEQLVGKLTMQLELLKKLGAGGP